MIECDDSTPSVVVVPDGLAAARETGRAQEAPSFVFRAVLEHVRNHHARRHILLAPANDFGATASEQEVGRRYLAAVGLTNLEAPPHVPDTGYIDTAGNAFLLRRYLSQQGRWPFPPITLVVARRHARRAAFCFRQAGFRLAEVEAVPYEIPSDEPVVRRLFYYRHPWLHDGYEYFAMWRERLRFSSGD